ncbi:MAG: BamA/TamA family outer membrane protein [Calditrichia bacterium]|nr:BamA/TamA family outer membrane protein [Calditrichia bacterium]
MTCQTMSRIFILFGIILSLILTSHAQNTKNYQKKFDLFPIALYNSDIGFGVGAKTIFRNYMNLKESFDFIVFASTKGQQWYAFQFSMPDFELRQGEMYPLAFDVRIEWDKLLVSNFFGIGNNTPDNNYQFPREIFRIHPVLSHTFSRTIIAEAGYQLGHYVIYGYDPSWGTITPDTPGAEPHLVSLLYGSLRLDTRNSFINPSRGYRIYFKTGFSRPVFGSDWNYTRYRLETSIYQQIFFTNHIVAGRLWLQHISGIAPYQELSKIGDGWTARGYKADRFLDNSMILTSLEYRFPLYRALGGVLFTDAGRVADKLSALTLDDWHFNVGWGLRYHLSTFVTRFDMGISHEGVRIFFNFGHVF